MDLSGLVREACELFVPVAEDKKIDFSHGVADNIHIKGDAKMLQRAFSNLLDNAVKYTRKKGQVSVRLSLEPPGAVVIRVEDTGPGIHPDNLEKIFERFYRAESSRTSPGTGLGLSLARTIVRQHKGDILVTSQPGRGSCFSMRLPYRNIQVI